MTTEERLNAREKYLRKLSPLRFGGRLHEELINDKDKVRQILASSASGSSTKTVYNESGRLHDDRWKRSIPDLYRAYLHYEDISLVDFIRDVLPVVSERYAFFCTYCSTIDRLVWMPYSAQSMDSGGTGSRLRMFAERRPSGKTGLGIRLRELSDWLNYNQ
jgi:hypothetical protein